MLMKRAFSRAQAQAQETDQVLEWMVWTMLCLCGRLKEKQVLLSFLPVS